MEVKPVDKDQFVDYHGFLSPRRRVIVQERLNSDECLCIGAMDGTRPMGLGIVTYQRSQPNAFLHHVYVRPESRGRGIGGRITAMILDHARRAGFEALTISFFKERDGSPFLERLLNRYGFVETYRSKVFNILVTKEDLDDLLNHLQGFIAKQHDLLLNRFAVISLSDLTPTREARIRRSLQGERLEERFQPFVNVPFINREKSFFVLKDEEPAAWAIICNAGINGVIYKTLYIRKPYRGKGLFVMMLIRGVEWLCDSGTITRALFNSDVDNKAIFSMMPRLLAPCDYAVRTHSVMTKKFRNEPDQQKEI